MLYLDMTTKCVSFTTFEHMYALCLSQIDQWRKQDAR